MVTGSSMTPYTDARARSVFRESVKVSATVRNASDGVDLHFLRRAHLPIIVACGLLNAPTPIPWR
jgi:hypothetical protein